jgi:hypothetical protein
MLRKDVIEAVEAGQFSIYPVETVDQGIELLTGIPAGEPDENGQYPEDTINGLVQKRLAELSEIRKEYDQEIRSAVEEDKITKEGEERKEEE